MLQKIPAFVKVGPAELNKVVEYVNRITDIKVSPPLEILHASGGTQLRVVDDGFMGKVSGAACGEGGKHFYSVTEVFEIANGNWEVLDNGRDLAYPDFTVTEWNDSPVDIGTIVWVEQYKSDITDWRFDHCCGTEFCSSSSSSSSSSVGSSSSTDSTSSASGCCCDQVVQQVVTGVDFGTDPPTVSYACISVCAVYPCPSSSSSSSSSRSLTSSSSKCRTIIGDCAHCETDAWESYVFDYEGGITTLVGNWTLNYVSGCTWCTGDCSTLPYWELTYGTSWTLTGYYDPGSGPTSEVCPLFSGVQWCILPGTFYSSYDSTLFTVIPNDACPSSSSSSSLSSGSSASSPSCGGDCKWFWDGDGPCCDNAGNWIPLVDDCSLGFNCIQPDRKGNYASEIVWTSCCGGGEPESSSSSLSSCGDESLAGWYCMQIGTDPGPYKCGCYFCPCEIPDSCPPNNIYGLPAIAIGGPYDTPTECADADCITALCGGSLSSGSLSPESFSDISSISIVPMAAIFQYPDTLYAEVNGETIILNKVGYTSYIGENGNMGVSLSKSTDWEINITGSIISDGTVNVNSVIPFLAFYDKNSVNVTITE